MKQLSDNTELRRQIRKALQGGLPCLAECGGFMYLHEKMEDMEGREYPMTGAIPEGPTAQASFQIRIYYLKPEPEKGQQLLLPGEEIKAHEFHYFDSENPGEAYCARKPAGKETGNASTE